MTQSTRQGKRIVLASPNDVSKERAIVTTVVEELNQGIARSNNIVIELAQLGDGRILTFHVDGPQGAVDAVLWIADAEIVLGLLLEALRDTHELIH